MKTALKPLMCYDLANDEFILSGEVITHEAACRRWYAFDTDWTRLAWAAMQEYIQAMKAKGQ